MFNMKRKSTVTAEDRKAFADELLSALRQASVVDLPMLNNVIDNVITPMQVEIKRLTREVELMHTAIKAMQSEKEDQR